MAAVRDELLAREITREELQVLVEEYVAKGGKIRQFKPADAYSFHPNPFASVSRNADGQLQARRSLRSWLLKPETPAKAKTVKTAKPRKVLTFKKKK